MEMTMRKKIVGAVLTLAASGFGVDRWMLGSGPAEADAGTASQAVAGLGTAPSAGESPAADKKAVPAGTAEKPGARRSLAARLQDVAAAEQLELAAIPDAFQASKLWKPLVPVVTTAPPPAAPPPDPAVEFRAKHKLTAVMRSGMPGGGLAMIDGKTVVSGDPVGDSGFVLVAVLQDGALFRKGTAGGVSSQVVLPLEGPGKK